MKRTLSLLLAVLMVAACFAVMVSCGDDATTTAGTTTAAAGTTTAQGTTKAGTTKVTTTKKARTTRPAIVIEVPTFWEKGEGTKDDPYLIETADDLDLFVAKSAETNFSGKYVALANDIIYNDTTVENWWEKDNVRIFKGIGSKSMPFSGTFDGNGHVIEGIRLLYNTKKDEPCANIRVGFINQCGTATLQNIGLWDLRLNIVAPEDQFPAGNVYEAYCAGLCAGGDNLTIHNCSLFCNIKTDVMTEGNGTTGGALFGYIGSSLKVTNCFGAGYAYTKHGVFCSGAGNGSVDQCICLMSSEPGETLGNWSAKMACSNMYTRAEGPTHAAITGWTFQTESCQRVALADFLGDKAKTSCPTLDWVTLWQANEGYMPCLKMFANTKFATMETPDEIVDEAGAGYETQYTLSLADLTGVGGKLKADGTVDAAEIHWASTANYLYLQKDARFFRTNREKEIVAYAFDATGAALTDALSFDEENQIYTVNKACWIKYTMDAGEFSTADDGTQKPIDFVEGENDPVSYVRGIRVALPAGTAIDTIVIVANAGDTTPATAE